MEESVQMTVDHEAHLEHLKAAALERLDEKYRAGQLEHGGRLWEKPAMLKHLRDEVIDLVVYEDVTRQQLEAVCALLNQACDSLKDDYYSDTVKAVFAARDKVDALLHGKQD